MKTDAENEDSQNSSVQHHDFKTMLAGCVGNALEWYDFSVYAFVSDIIGDVFFPPSNNPNINLIKSFGVFGIAFLVRPIGAAVFGLMGDNTGRKSAVENSIIVMAIPTFMLGLLPSYESVGWVSPALLITCRIFQGFSVGGQLSSSLVFLLEGAEEEKWGMQAALVAFANTMGAVLGSLISFILRATLSDEELRSYGWRIPFMFGILGMVPGLYLKYRGKEIMSHETDHRPKLEKKDTFSEVFGEGNRRALIAALFVPMLGSGGYYIIFVFLGVFMETIVHVENGFGINTAVLSSGLVLVFVGGWLADKFGPQGRVPLMLMASLALGIVSPFFINIMGKGDPTVCFFLQFTMALLLGIFMGSATPWVVAKFPRHMRLTSVALTHSVGVSVVGGFSPALATFLVTKYNNYAPGYILSVLAAVAWIGVWIGSSESESKKSKNTEKVELLENKKLSDMI